MYSAKEHPGIKVDGIHSQRYEGNRFRGDNKLLIKQEKVLALPPISLKLQLPFLVRCYYRLNQEISLDEFQEDKFQDLKDKELSLYLLYPLPPYHSFPASAPPSAMWSTSSSTRSTACTAGISTSKFTTSTSTSTASSRKKNSARSTPSKPGKKTSSTSSSSDSKSETALSLKSKAKY